MKSFTLRKISMLALAATLSTAGLMTTVRADDAAAPAKAEKGEKGKRGERQQPKWLEQLNLTDAQKEQLKPIMKDAADKRKAMRDDATLTPEQKREKNKAIRDEMMEKIKPILTDDQKKTLEEAAKEGKNRQKKDKDGAAKE